MTNELKYSATYFDDGYDSDNLMVKIRNFISYNFIGKGGHLFINDTDIFFKPHFLNFGTGDQVVSDGDRIITIPYRKGMKISSITRYEKGILPTSLVVFSNTGHKMKLLVFKRDEIINEIEARMSGQ